MFGIDLGISTSSVSCITERNQVVDCQIIFGHKTKNEWKKTAAMSEAICNSVDTMCKSHPGTYIGRLVSIEEPVYAYRVRNYRSFFWLSCLYALVRRKLEIRGFRIYSVNPVSVKATAKALAFKKKRLKLIYAVRGRLTKKGMVKAYHKLIGSLPPYHTILGRETLADSFFIARTGIDRRKVGIR